MSKQAALGAISRMNMQASLVAPFSITSVAAALQQLLTINIEDEVKRVMDHRSELLAAYGFGSQPVDAKPFAFAQGLAIIPVQGTLVNRFGQSYGYVTGYNFIRSQMNAAMADPDVKGIVFDVNTYGGEAAGCFELSAEIAALTKPTLGVVDSNAYSAGYAILSAVDKAVATPSGGVGSVGVITMHMSYANMLAKEGIDVTLIYSGDHKADGNPFEQLPDAVKSEIQASVDARRLEFSTLVASNRGLDVKTVQDTEAAIYRAAEAVQLGLIDAVATPAEAVAAFLNELSGSQKPQEISMSTTANAQPVASASSPVNTDQQMADARKCERERISAIIGCEEAKGKSTLANHLALNTQVSVDDAKAMLAVAAVEQAAAPKPTETNHFAQAMNSTQNPNVGSDQSLNSDQSVGLEGPTQAQKMLMDYQAATGKKLQ